MSNVSVTTPSIFTLDVYAGNSRNGNNTWNYGRGDGVAGTQLDYSFVVIRDYQKGFLSSGTTSALGRLYVDGSLVLTETTPMLGASGWYGTGSGGTPPNIVVSAGSFFALNLGGSGTYSILHHSFHLTCRVIG